MEEDYRDSASTYVGETEVPNDQCILCWHWHCIPLGKVNGMSDQGLEALGLGMIVSFALLGSGIVLVGTFRACARAWVYRSWWNGSGSAVNGL
jgi:hypothetical protein